MQVRRRWRPVVLGLIAAVVAVWWVARDGTARSAIGNVSVQVLLVVIVLQSANVATDSVRYRMVLPQRFRAQLGRWEWHRIFAVGRLLNQVIPQGGMAYRAAHLKLALGLPVAAFFGSVAVISWLGNGLVLLLVGIPVAAMGRPLVGAGVAGLGLAILILIALVPRLARDESRARRFIPSRLRGLVESFSESFVELLSGSRRLWSVLGMTLLTQLSGAAAFILVCVALGIDDPFLVGAVLYAATTVMTFVSLTPASVGITELAAGLAGGILDVGSAVGVLVAVVIRLTGVLSTALLAAIAGLFEGARERQV